MKIKIEIDTEGKVVVEGIDIVGPGCQQVLEPFNQLGKVLSQEAKPEFYQTSEESTWQKTNQ